MVVEIKRQVCDGHILKMLVEAGYVWLQHNQDVVNQLNVFPVPDGDTGSNMRLTMKKAYDAVSELDEAHVGIVAGKAAQGALFGARGNSGVILSQLLRGFADGIQQHEIFDMPLLVEACEQAVEKAYTAVMEPTEGTILTVAREATAALRKFAETSNDLVDGLEHLINAAKQSLENTPELLPVLKKAGVVDSGGQGLLFILEGMLRALHGEPLFIGGKPGSASNEQPTDEWQDALTPEDEEGYGYDVQFLMRGESMNVAQVRAEIDAMGWSTLVVGDERLIKVHVHVHDPGQPISYAIGYGASLDDVVVENMQAQYEQYVQERAALVDEVFHNNIDGIAVIAVVNGYGMQQVYVNELHAARVLMGGQTMNTSVDDFVEAIDSLDNQQIILLPNNSNIVMAAEQAALIANQNGRTVRVMPTRSVPQGVVAMTETALGMRETEPIDEVVETMREAVSFVKTIEVTQAVRNTQIDDMDILEGQYIGLVDGKLLVTSGNLHTTVTETLHKAGADEYELITLYYGDGLTKSIVQELVSELKMTYPEHVFKTVHGGQPLYPYIISLE